MFIPFSNELSFCGTAAGAFAGLILLVALSSGPPLLKLRNERSELYKVNVAEGRLEEEEVG